MHKKGAGLFGMVGVTVVMALTISPAKASGQNVIGFGVIGGASLAMGDLKPFDAGNGWHVGAVMNWGNALAPVSFRVDGVYDSFGLAEKPSSQGPGGPSGSTTTTTQGLSAISGTGNVVWTAISASGGMAPYVMGGPGVYNLRPDCIFTTSGVDSECPSDRPTTTKIGANAGVGVKLPLSRFKVGLEATYHYVFGEVEEGQGNATFARLSAVLHF